MSGNIVDWDIKSILLKIIWISSGFLILLGILIFVIQLSYVINPNSDFSTYFNGAKNLLSGKSVYPALIVQPPFSAILFVPFALFPYGIAAIAWSLLLGILYSGIFIILFKELTLPLSRPWKFLLIGFALCWHPYLVNISLGQISIVISILIIGSWALLRRNRDLLAGILLGIAVLVKLIPGIFLFYLLLRSRIKALTAAVLTIMVGMASTILLIGWTDVSYYFLHVIFNGSQEFILIPINTSISGAINHLLIDGYWIKPIHVLPQLATVLTILIIIGFLSLLTYLSLHIDHSMEGVDYSFSLAILSMLLLSPITWAHYFPVLLLPITLLFINFLKHPKTPGKAIGILAFLLLSLPDIEIARYLIQYYAPDRLPWYASLPFLAPTIGLILLWWKVARQAPLVV